MNFELLAKEGRYFGRTRLFNQKTQNSEEYEIVTSYPSESCYKKKAERSIQRHIKNLLQSRAELIDEGQKNTLHSNQKADSNSPKEKPMEFIRIRGNRIYFDFYYTDPNTDKTKRCQSSTGLKNNRENRIKAQQLASEKRAVLSQSNPKPPKEIQPKIAVIPKLIEPQVRRVGKEGKASLTMSEFVEYYKGRPEFRKLAKKSQQTYKTYLHWYVVPELGHLLLSEIEGDMIEDFEQEILLRGKSPKFTKDVLGFTRMLLNIAVRKRIIPYCPYFKISSKPTRKKPKYLDDDQCKQLLQYVQENEPDYLPIIHFTLMTGVRMGEARALLWENVNLDDPQPIVLIKYSMDIDGTLKSTKTNRERRIPLSKGLVKMLKEQKQSSPFTAEEDFVFCRENGKDLSKTTIHKVTVRSSRAIGVEEFSFHGLRHTFATKVVNKHGIAQAARLLGHTDIKTTMIYYQEDIKVLSEIVADLDIQFD